MAYTMFIVWISYILITIKMYDRSRGITDQSFLLFIPCTYTRTKPLLTSYWVCVFHFRSPLQLCHVLLLEPTCLYSFPNVWGWRVHVYRWIFIVIIPLRYTFLTYFYAYFYYRAKGSTTAYIELCVNKWYSTASDFTEDFFLLYSKTFCSKSKKKNGRLFP